MIPARIRLRAVAVSIFALSVLAAMVHANERARSQGVELILRAEVRGPSSSFAGEHARLTYTDNGSLAAGLDGSGALRAEFGPEPNSRDERKAVIAFARGASWYDAPAAVGPGSDRTAFGGAPTLVATARWGWRYDRGERLDEPRITLRMALPERYFADPQTARALDEAIRARNSWLSARRQAALEDRPFSEPEPGRIGVILSLPPGGGAPVIKGLIIGDERFDDTLTGPRRRLLEAIHEEE